jgi:DNA-directed RNA polymerase subunit E'/Rpb7
MATTTQRNYRPRNDQNQKKTEYSVYVRNMISTKIHLNMKEVGDSTKLNLERKIVYKTEGKCIPEGFVRPDSVKIITYSSGVVKMNLIEFQVVFECLICNPVEGQMVECKTKSITKAGIHAEVITDRKFIPMKIFVARDHNYSNKLFGGIKEDDTINVRIIGKRFELNDPYIVAIASLVDGGQQQQQRQPYQKQANPRIRVLEDAALNMEDADEFVEPEQYQDELGEEEERAPISIPTVNPSST